MTNIYIFLPIIKTLAKQSISNRNTNLEENKPRLLASRMQQTPIDRVHLSAQTTLAIIIEPLRQ